MSGPASVVEDYFLVCLKDALDHPAVIKLRQALDSPQWQQALAQLPGYQPATECGAVLSLVQALPWWHYRAPKGGSGLPPQPASATDDA